MNCVRCNAPTDGYKCDICGVESAEHDPVHGCGGDHCQPKCRRCNEAESRCGCEMQ